jgi:hypothetical protein
LDVSAQGLKEVFGVQVGNGRFKCTDSGEYEVLGWGDEERPQQEMWRILTVALSKSSGDEIQVKS